MSSDTDRRSQRTAAPFRRRQRQHGASQPFDRRELERHGWRTTLEYRENLVRARSGRLEHVVVFWRAEAERVERSGATVVVVAEASSPTAAWSRLRTEADLSGVVARHAAGTPGGAVGAPERSRRVLQHR